MLSKDIIWLDPKSIIIPIGRQRRDASEIEDLIPSIRERGVINPVIINLSLEIVAGERRTRASIAAGLELIPARQVERLSPLELKIIELEENERRKDLPWRDHVLAIAEIHGAYAELAKAKGEGWSQERTAELLFYERNWIARVLRVHRDLENPRIKDAPGLNAAYNILLRLDERKIGDALSTIADAGKALENHKRGFSEPEAGGTQRAEPSSEGSVERTRQGDSREDSRKSSFGVDEDILCIDFIRWLGAYSGPRFNFVHCDFPYGINAFAGPQSGRDKSETYDDDPNVYWKLLRVFCENLDKFMSSSAHLVFWLSGDVDIMHETIEAFGKLAPELKFNSKPLIWHKSNNVGILSDPKRGPRHVYETALIASRGDRLILKATSDLYSAPKENDFHPSSKNEAMLRYFFGMFVDEFTEIFDPTCGGGAALRAAESLGAKRVLGLELSSEHCEAARVALRQFRAKASAGRKAG